MNWIENMLIIAGISLDIFAATECQGSLVAKVEKKQLTCLCLLVSIWQFAALYIGNFLSALLMKKDDIAENEVFIGNVIAAAIFVCLGISLVVKAVKNERIHEHREENLGVLKFVHKLAGASIYTLLAGIAFGFVGTNLRISLTMMVYLSVLVVIAGVYTGYRFGFEQKRKAYTVGAVLLWIVGLDVVVRHILEVF